MWSRGVILLLALTTVLALDREVAKDKVTEYRVHSQNLHVAELEEEVTKLEAAFEKLSHPIEDIEVSRVKARIRRYSPSNCAKTEVSCGGDYPECVHNLLVCDGIKDCHNGMDEDAKVCDASIVRVGSTFTGVTHWKSCVEVHDHPTVITITSNHRSDFFGPRIWVRAAITNELSDNFMEGKLTSYTARGYFVFASRQLVLIPDANAPHRYGIVCSFYFGDYDHADCRVVQESSMNKCAKLRVKRS